jgi:hypothetical protein
MGRCGGQGKSLARSHLATGAKVAEERGGHAVAPGSLACPRLLACGLGRPGWALATGPTPRHAPGPSTLCQS